MTLDEVLAKLQSRFPQAGVQKVDTQPDAHLSVDAKGILEVLRFLRDELQFETLANLGGVDLLAESKLVVVYHPFSYTHKLIVPLKVTVNREVGVKVPSVCSIYKAANWLERETYDMFGIDFEGHPDLRRILLPDDWKGYPLLRDYKTPDYYNGMPIPLYFGDPPDEGKPAHGGEA